MSNLIIQAIPARNLTYSFTNTSLHAYERYDYYPATPATPAIPAIPAVPARSVAY